MGASQCVLSCVSMLALYVAGTREGWRDGLRATLIFSFSRLFAYVLLGLVAGFSGTFLADFLHNPGFGSYLWISAGAFISLLGVLVILGKEPRFHFCRALSQHTVNDSTKSMFDDVDCVMPNRSNGSHTLDICPRAYMHHTKMVFSECQVRVWTWWRVSHSCQCPQIRYSAVFRRVSRSSLEEVPCEYSSR